MKDNTDLKRFVTCVKQGSKYSSNYVNVLKNMVSRNLSLSYEFVCFTDDTQGLDKDISVVELPKNIQGWWNKLYIFEKSCFRKGVVLYLDLDIVVSGNIDKLFEWCPNNWCIIRDFTKVMRPDCKKYNSSVIRFNSGELDAIWTQFQKQKTTAIRKYHGDQDFIYECNKDAKLWPDNWIQSWKWQIRSDKTLEPNGVKGNRSFRRIEHVIPPGDCCITVFHGDPKPHNCKDPWVIDNWK